MAFGQSLITHKQGLLLFGGPVSRRAEIQAIATEFHYIRDTVLRSLTDKKIVTEYQQAIANGNHATNRG